MADSDDGSVRAVEHPALAADRPLVDLRQDHRRLHRLLPVHGLLHGLSYRLRLARRRYDAEHGRPRLALRLPPRHIPAAVLADDGSVAAAHQPADVRRYGARTKHISPLPLSSLSPACCLQSCCTGTPGKSSSPRRAPSCPQRIFGTSSFRTVRCSWSCSASSSAVFTCTAAAAS